MAAWSFVLAEPAPTGLGFRQLTAATSRRVTWRLDDACDASFDIDGRHDEASEIEELATDLLVYRDGSKVLRGRIGSESDEIDASTHQASFAAIDYRGMLQYRFVGAAGATYIATDQAAIAWGLINTSQALSGGNWGITNGVGSSSGTNRDRTYDPGKPLSEALAELGRVDDGFEWEIDADLALNRWFPTRGSANGVVLDYGGLVTQVRRNLDPSAFANSVLAVGDQALVPATAVTAGIGTDPRGRWERSFGYSSIKEQATLDARALWLADQTNTLRPEYVVTLRDGAWEGFDHIGLGDTVTLAVKSGRLQVADAQRVVEIAVDLDDDGAETVTLGLVAA